MTVDVEQLLEQAEVRVRAIAKARGVTLKEPTAEELKRYESLEPLPHEDPALHVKLLDEQLAANARDVGASKRPCTCGAGVLTDREKELLDERGRLLSMRAVMLEIAAKRREPGPQE